ncbi:MAG: thermonuclease family protein [Dehalococcoidia bacterium]
MRRGLRAAVLFGLAVAVAGCREASPVYPAETGCIVQRVADGDTITVSGCMESRVRLLLVDAPEVAGGGSEAECYGEEAQAYLRSRLPVGSTVRMERGVLDRDRYDRALRYVWLGNELLNETLVQQGFAVRYRDAEDTTFRDRIAAAEAEARAAGRGLWNACP